MQHMQRNRKEAREDVCLSSDKHLLRLTLVKDFESAAAPTYLFNLAMNATTHA